VCFNDYSLMFMFRFVTLNCAEETGSYVLKHSFTMNRGTMVDPVFPLSILNCAGVDRLVNCIIARAKKVGHFMPYIMLQERMKN